MKVGIPKEIKNNENRVGMTPAGVAELVKNGHEVFVQHTAGEGSGFPDEQYTAVGAKILPTIEDVYATADMIVKVKEPIAEEYPLIHQDQLVFTYFHFACDKELTDAMLKSGAVCLAYETVETDNHHLPACISNSPLYLVCQLLNSNCLSPCIIKVAHGCFIVKTFIIYLIVLILFIIYLSTHFNIQDIFLFLFDYITLC